MTAPQPGALPAVRPTLEEALRELSRLTGGWADTTAFRGGLTWAAETFRGPCARGAKTPFEAIAQTCEQFPDDHEQAAALDDLARRCRLSAPQAAPVDGELVARVRSLTDDLEMAARHNRGTGMATPVFNAAGLFILVADLRALLAAGASGASAGVDREPGFTPYRERLENKLTEDLWNWIAASKLQVPGVDDDTIPEDERPRDVGQLDLWQAIRDSFGRHFDHIPSTARSTEVAALRAEVARLQGELATARAEGERAGEATNAQAGHVLVPCALLGVAVLAAQACVGHLPVSQHKSWQALSDALARLLGVDSGAEYALAHALAFDHRREP